MTGSGISSVVERPRVGVLNTSLFYLDPIHEINLREFADVTKKNVPGNAGADLLVPELEGFDAIIASVTPNFTPDVLKGLSRLRLISRTGIGYNSIDIESATALGIIVSIVEGDVERNSVAEHAVSLLASTTRQLPQSVNLLRDAKVGDEKDWKKAKGHYGPEISGKTVGIIGLGNIGSRSAEILSRGFDCKVLAYDPLREDDFRQFGAANSSLEQLLRKSDFVLLHCSLNDQTLGIIGEPQLATMKKGAYLINTARGGLVDPQAILQALDSGHLAGYGADVYINEPFKDLEAPLALHPKVVAVPHLGGNSLESTNGISSNCVVSMHNFFIEGQLPPRPVNPEAIANLHKRANVP